MTPETARPSSIRCLDIFQSIRQKAVRVWETFESAIAMGLIDDETFTPFDTAPFDETKAVKIDSKGFGLEIWERQAVASAFESASSVLVVAAGGLRELVALQESGFTTAGVEYGPRLYEASKQWLDQNQPDTPLWLADRYQIENPESPYDACFIARSFYSHIRGADQRIEFLRKLREQLKPGAPVVLSYYTCVREATFRIQAMIANVIRKLRSKGPRVEVGDHIDPESSLYHHHFTAAGVADELKQAGFDTVEQRTTWFGWTVARTTDVHATNCEKDELNEASAAVLTS